MTAPRTYWAGQGIQLGCYQGTAGCFVQRSDGEILLLGNAHVMFGTARPVVDRVVRTPTSSSSCCQGDHFADVIGDPVSQDVATELTNSIGERFTWSGGVLDAAVAELRPDVFVRNELPQLGMIQGVPSDRGFATGAPLGREPDPEHYVRLYSRMRGTVSYGTIIHVSGTKRITFPGSMRFGRRTQAWLGLEGIDATGATVELPDYLYPRAVDRHTPLVAQYIIMPRADPRNDGDLYARYARHADPFGDLKFGVPGDSGSVVVNHRNEVIALYHGGNSVADIGLPTDDAAIEWRAVEEMGIATPIQFVLDQIDADIPPGLSNVRPAYGALPYPESEVIDRGIERLRAGLAETRLGRVVIAKIEQHREEANQLVNKVREVGLTWHYHRGPGFVRHARENVRDPSYPIPTVINGRERTALLARMADMFERHGSEELRRDVGRYRSLVLELLANATSLDAVVASVQREHAVHA